MTHNQVSTDPRKKLNLKNPTHLFATGFGSGLLPAMPGTWGSLLATLLGAIVLKALGWQLFLAFTAICFWVGCIICNTTANDMEVHDHGAIVWDEFVGVFITLLAVPVLNWSWLFLAFFAFRFFDILKPYPIKYFDQKLTNGFGIMIDDVLAGLYAMIVLYLVRYFI